MIKIFSLLLLVFFSLAAIAKENLPVETESPASETEIICFAAMEKWVCAPASDQQQAKTKAMRLIDEKSRQAPVVIKALPLEKQWQEAVIEEPTEVVEPAVTDSEGMANVTATTGQSVLDKPDIEQIKPVQNESNYNQSGSQIESQGQSQNFSKWKDQHAMQWTLQVVGTTNLPNLEDFINKYQLNNEIMSIATTEVKGAPWHIVLVGVFDDRDQAVAYKTQLGSKGENWAKQAWPRPIAGIVTIE